jgi:hypothetical protein
MRDLLVKLEMNHPDKTPLTRREALLDTLKATLVTSLTLPAMADASPVPPPAPEPEFVPENDYPFFGGELPEGY